MTKNFWPDTTRVEHEGFTLDIAKAAIRNITYQGSQIIDLLYTAIRPVDWSTLEATEHFEEINNSGENCIIKITDIFNEGLKATSIITLKSNGRFNIAYELVGSVETKLNRWGICFCLNSADWIGATISYAESKFVLSNDISPQVFINGITQGLFPAANEMKFEARDGRSIFAKSSGKVLEAEDQRNWTDNSYKIYSGSLSEPLPIAIAVGHKFTQEIEFELTSQQGQIVDGSKILVKEIDSLPRIGVQFNAESTLTNEDLDRALTILDIDHIRINEESLTTQKMAFISSHGLLLEAALLSSHSEEELGYEIEHLSARVPAGSRLLVQREGRQLVEAKDLPKNNSLNSIIPGTDGYLVDLHRDKRDFGNSVSYSITPSVHTSDLESIFKTLQTQSKTIEFAKRRIAPQVSISPITLSTRGNPETGHLRENRNNFSQPDLAGRIKTIEAASWTLGSIFALASADAFSGTWHELFGEFGIIYSENGATKFSTTFHALAALGAHHAHEITIATCVDQSWVGFEDRESGKMIVASKRPWNIKISEKVLAGYKSMQSLRADDCEKASQIMDWWSYSEISAISSEFPLALTPFEIALLRR